MIFLILCTKINKNIYNVYVSPEQLWFSMAYIISSPSILMITIYIVERYVVYKQYVYGNSKCMLLIYLQVPFTIMIKVLWLFLEHINVYSYAFNITRYVADMKTTWISKTLLCNVECLLHSHLIDILRKGNYCQIIILIPILLLERTTVI